MLTIQRLIYVIYCGLGVFPSMALVTIDVGVPYSIRWVHVVGLVLLVLLLINVDSRWKLVEFFRNNRFFAAFILLALLVALLAGIFFSGLPVMSPRVGIDFQIDQKTPLAFGLAQAAHLAYLLLGILYVAGAYVLIDEKYINRFGLLMVGLGVLVISFSTWHLLANKFYFYYPNSLLYSNQRLEHIWHTSYNLVMGTFSEPSLLAAFLVGYVGTLWAAAFQRIINPWLMFFLLLASVAFLIASKSTTGFLGLLLCVVISVIAGFGNEKNLLHRRIALIFVALILFCGIGMYGLFPKYFDLVLIKKIGGVSFNNRGAADAYSLTVLHETYYMGAGLGVNATNSLLAYVASSLGIGGLFIFLYLVANPFWIIYPVKGLKRAFFGCLPSWSLVLVMSLSNPSLDFPPFWMALAWSYLQAWSNSQWSVDASS